MKFENYVREVLWNTANHGGSWTSEEEAVNYIMANYSGEDADQAKVQEAVHEWNSIIIKTE